MNTGRSHTIGVVVGDIENPHFGLATRGITDIAKRSGFNVILVNTDEDTGGEIDAVRVLLDKRVDGLIVAPASSVETQHLRRVLESGRPLVLLDRKAPGLDVHTVAVDMAGHLGRFHHGTSIKLRPPQDRRSSPRYEQTGHTGTACSWTHPRFRTVATA